MKVGSHEWRVQRDFPASEDMIETAKRLDEEMEWEARLVADPIANAVRNHATETTQHLLRIEDTIERILFGLKFIVAVIGAIAGFLAGFLMLGGF